jgi:nitroreductase
MNAVELTEAVRGRRSADRLTDPAPSDAEVVAYIRDATTAPDHGRLRPWRFVFLRGPARDRLGQAFAEDVPADDPAGRERAAAKPLRAPLLLSVVFAPQESPKVPEWEQLAAVAALVQNLHLLLFGDGWGVMWRTGAPTDSPGVRELLGLTAAEQLLGWLYIGKPVPNPSQPPRPELPLTPDRFTALVGDAIVEVEV